MSDKIQELDRSDLDLIHGGNATRTMFLRQGIANNVMTVLDNPVRAAKSVGLAGTAGSPGQQYVPAQTRPDGSIRDGHFTSPSSGPEVPRGM